MHNFKPGHVYRVKIHDTGAEAVVWATTTDLVTDDDDVYDYYEAEMLEELSIVPGLYEQVTRLKNVQGSFDVLKQFFGSKKSGKTTLTDTWSLVADVVKNLEDVLDTKPERKMLQEPTGFGAIVKVEWSTGVRQLVQRSHLNEWTAYTPGTGLVHYTWSQVAPYVIEVVYEGA